MTAQPQRVSIVRTSRAELVARELEREIIDDRTVGDRLGTKDQLRQRFGVAVATFNEAVRLLEMRGLIAARPGPGGGVFVSRPGDRVTFSHTVLGFSSDATTYEECLEVRDALEPLIDRHAALYHRAGDIRDLTGLLAAMDASINEPSAFFVANWALHRRIAKLCRNIPLQSIYVTLIDFLQLSISEAAFTGFDGPAMMRIHRDLVSAIDKGDGPHLDAAVEAHQPTQLLARRRGPLASPRSGTRR